MLLSGQDTLGTPVTSRDINELALLTRNPRIVTAAQQVTAVLGTTLRTQYPHFVPSPKTPGDLYTLEMALSVYDVAHELLLSIRRQIQTPLDENVS